MLTMEETRKIVGPNSKLTDDEIDQLRKVCDVMARIAVDAYIRKKQKERERREGEESAAGPDEEE